MPVSDIVVNVGYEGKQIQIPVKGNQLILSLVRKCLDMEMKNRPTFREILEILQHKNKDNQKKSKPQDFWWISLILIGKVYSELKLFFGNLTKQSVF